MFSLRKFAAFCALLAIGAPATTLAADSMMGKSHMMGKSGMMSDDVKPLASRFSGPGVYVGRIQHRGRERQVRPEGSVPVFRHCSWLCP